VGRSDFGRIVQQHRGIADNVGDTAIWRRHIGAASVSDMARAAGDDGASTYFEQTCTGLFRTVVFGEQLVNGGQVVAGDVVATIVDAVPSQNDEIVWRGTTYRVESDTLPQQIMGASGYRLLLRRGQ
jgi:hypothetical protein